MQPAASQQTGWRERFTALKNLPQVMRLVWHAAPGVVTGGLLFRIAVALIPLAILAVSKRIIDIVVSAVKGSGTSSPSDVWMWLAIQFVLAAGGLALGRAIDYFDARLADEFTRDVSLRVMQHAATLDLACFEDANFYDKLERARVQATDRIALANIDFLETGPNLSGGRPGLLFAVAVRIAAPLRGARLRGREPLCVPGLFAGAPADAGPA